MSLFNIKEIEDHLALKTEGTQHGRTGISDGSSKGVQETFEPVVAGNEKMAQNIIKNLAPITEGL